MPIEYNPYIPATIDEILDKLDSMMLSPPRFEDTSGYFPGKNIDTEFFALSEGLRRIRKKLGEENYQTLTVMSERMRAHFEADPEDKTDDAHSGREIILEMSELLNEIWARELRESSK